MENIDLFWDFFEHPSEIRQAYLMKRISKEIRAHKHGGTLLIVNDKNSWRNSIDEAMPFTSESPYQSMRLILSGIYADIKKEYEKDNRISTLTDELREFYTNNIISLFSSLTAIDGATIIDKDFDVHSFGAKIKMENKPIEVIVKEPFKDSLEQSVKLEELGGMRHQSGATFANQNVGFAVVASQDGKVSLMYFDKEIGKVRVLQHIEYLFA